MNNEFKYTEEVTGEIVQIPIGLLHHHHDNPRKDLGDLTELTDSIKAKGILQNLTVVPYWFKITGVGCDDPEEQAAMGYLVVIGNRRLEAAKRAGLETLPCIISNMTPAEQVQTMLLENMQRTDLTAYEQAQGFQMMMDFGDTIDTVAEKTGFSKSTIRRRLKMAELDGETLKAVSSRQVSMMDYDSLSEIEDIETRNKVLAEIGTSNFNRELQKALSAQKEKKDIETWRALCLARKMKEIPYSELWDQKYKNLGWLGGEPDEEELNSVVGDNDPLYFGFGNRGTVYIRTDATLDEDEEITEEEKARAEEQERRDRLSDLYDSTFELRFSYIKNYTYTDSKKNIKKITDWMCIREIVSMMSSGLFTGYCTVQASKDRFAELYFIEPNDSWEKVAEFVNKHPEKALLMNVYAQWCDGRYLGCSNYDRTYKRNKKLEWIYKGLVALGYEMSDEEKQMLNGTHPLYKKDDTDEAIDTEHDEIESVDEVSEDEFDGDLEAKLGEILGDIKE